MNASSAPAVPTGAQPPFVDISEDRLMRRVRRAGCVAALGAVLWPIGVGVRFLVVPSYSSGGVSSTSGSSQGMGTTTTATLVEVNGPGVLFVLAIPVALAVVGVIGGGRTARLRALFCGALLYVACLAAALTVGLAYVPGAMLLIVAGVFPDRRWRRPPPAAV